jgi:uncharacterized protein
MALVNHAKQEINAKIVYFGPSLSGKATNLNFIFKKLKPDFRGQFKSMNVQGSRMLFFDFLPSGQGKVNDYAVRFHIYTMQGEVPQDAAWKMVLKGVDGVVFVADAAPERQADNKASLDRLQTCLSVHGMSLQNLPVVVQHNKSDLAHAVPVAELQSALGLPGVNVLPVVASRGEGVLESLFTLVKMILKRLPESGLELAREPEQEQSITESEEFGRDEISYGSVENTLANTGSLEVEAHQSPNAACTAPLPVVTILEGAQVSTDGRLLLPLAINCGGTVRRVTLSVAISLEAV